MSREFTFRGGGGVQPQYNLGVLMLEDCEGAMNWVKAGTGGDDVCAFTVASAYFGGKGLDLRTRATTPTIGDWVSATRQLTMPLAKRIVVRGRLRFADISDVSKIRLSIVVYSGVRELKASFEIRPNDPIAAYLNSAGSYTNIATLNASWADGVWAAWEFAFDWDLKEYIKAVLAGVEVDLSGLAIQNVGASTNRRVTVEVLTIALAAAQAQVELDSIYVGEYERL